VTYIIPIHTEEIFQDIIQFFVFTESAVIRGDAQDLPLITPDAVDLKNRNWLIKN
jgi:hypothetical protein